MRNQTRRVERLIDRYLDHLQDAAYVRLVREALYYPNQGLRWNAVHTLGKLMIESNTELLSRAFPFYLERDPLTLPAVMSELGWLKNRPIPWEYVDRALGSPLYLARWSLLDVVGSVGVSPGSRDARRISRLCTTLAVDEHPQVRAEAVYTLDKKRAEWRELAKLEKGSKLPPEMGAGEAVSRTMARVDELRRGEPDLTFFGLRAEFWHYLSIAGGPDYDVETLDAYVRYRRVHPYPSAPVEKGDLEAYMRSFHSLRPGLGPAG